MHELFDMIFSLPDHRGLTLAGIVLLASGILLRRLFASGRPNAEPTSVSEPATSLAPRSTQPDLRTLSLAENPARASQGVEAVKA